MSARAPWFIRGGRELHTDCPYGLMGIINLTADSFYDGGKNLENDNWLSLGNELLEAGAHVLDFGAESSRPGACELSADEEQARLMPRLARFVNAFPRAIISVDTYHASTARRALELGVHIINDISACRHDPELADVIAQYRPGYVLMHSQGRPSTMQEHPEYENVMDEISFFFEDGLSRLTRNGIKEENVILDPGIGFGKTLFHNLSILRNIEKLKKFGRPLLVGLSMKSMFGHLMDIPLAQRGPITMTAVALLWRKGVFWHRVHDVKSAKDALALACNLYPSDV